MTMIRLLSQGVAVAFAFATLAALPALAQDSFGQASRQSPSPQQQQPQQQQFPQGQQQSPQGQQFPQQQPYPQPAPNGGGASPNAGGFGQPGFGAPPAAGGAANLDQLMQIERQDFGVPPTPQLHAGEMHGPTPASIPGGQVITTKGLVELMRGGQAPVLVLDVLGGPEIIQGAQQAVPAAQSGSFNDQTQQQFGQYLQGATSGSKQYPIVLYCLSPQCWMSYNASLRAINLGYTNVLWYRGGIESWKQAGMPVQRVQ
jgi:PQQ-dependent catabolism-associated CXXCW motif protein